MDITGKIFGNIYVNKQEMILTQISDSNEP